MYGKRLLLLIAACLGIAVFFKSETYSRWINTFILNPNTPISDQFDRTTVEERREYRYQNVYRLVQYMKKTLDTTRYKEPAVVLLPPNAYLDHIGQNMLHMPEPAEFYYHSGIVTSWTTSPYVQKCNWAVVSKGAADIAFIHIDSAERQALLEIYKNFKPAL